MAVQSEFIDLYTFSITLGTEVRAEFGGRI
jgi:hypothetical protein